MKLLIEEAQDVQFVTEEVQGKKFMYIEGIYMVMGKQNRNGRIYKPEYHIPAVHKYIEERVNDGRAWGELGHPQSPSIDHNNASHRIISLVQEGDNWIGKAVIAETPKGLIAKALIECGGKLGVSSRGLGNVKTIKGITYVEENFRLCTAADIVDEPSAQGAFVTSIMENTDWYFDELTGDWKSQQLVQETKNTINKMSRSQLQAQNGILLEKFMKRLAETYRYSK